MKTSEIIEKLRTKRIKVNLQDANYNNQTIEIAPPPAHRTEKELGFACWQICNLAQELSKNDAFDLYYFETTDAITFDVNDGGESVIIDTIPAELSTWTNT